MINVPSGPPMEEEEELEREEEEEAMRDEKEGGWLVPEAHFWVRAYNWTRQWLNPRRVRAITLGLHGCGKSAVLQRLQTGMPPLSDREPTVVPVWYEVPHRETIFNLLDTSGFLNRKAVWQQHVRSEGMKAIIFVIDASNRAAFVGNKELFQGPLLTAAREVPAISAVLVLMHTPPNKATEGEALDVDEVAKGLELLDEEGNEANTQALLRKRSSKGVGGKWVVLEGVKKPEASREVRWRVQCCSVEKGEGLRQALHWIYLNTKA